MLQVFLLRYPLDHVAAIFFLAQGHFRDTWAVYRAQLSCLRQFRKIKRKREKINEEVYLQTFQKSIVFQHYIKKRRRFDGNDLL